MYQRRIDILLLLVVVICKAGSLKTRFAAEALV